MFFIEDGHDFCCRISDIGKLLSPLRFCSEEGEGGSGAAALVQLEVEDAGYNKKSMADAEVNKTRQISADVLTSREK